MKIKRANAIGVASALGNKTIRIRLFIYFLILVLYISNHLSASTKHVTYVKIVLLPQLLNKWK
ncbi:hypothetical protein BSZ11_12935 [Staphylococcus sp. 47.1]|nr:hypothetical protein BSF33_13245 [Staphylococcus ureilyticus]OLF30401.1 hypothetical protein BSZ11_12935 [Staphylococcus sp. 47.1]